jgi:hypothetical protein
MIDKTDYYHGAALVHLLNDDRCLSLLKRESLGYVVNADIFVLLKYTSKARTPWSFTFDLEDIERCYRMAEEYKKVVLGLICGGDGVCALSWEKGSDLLGNNAGRIAVARKHNHSYSVWGTAGELKRKVSVSSWPRVLFEVEE